MLRSPVARISLGLVLMTISILLLGDMIGLVPKHSDVVLDSRKKFCEALAVQMSYSAQKNDLGAIHSTLGAIVERNEDVLSAALRMADGTIVVEMGDHSRYWLNVAAEHSTPTHTQVPIFRGSERFATVEVRFTPLAGGVVGILVNSLAGMIGLVGFVGFLGNCFFLKRALRHLDPSSVIPTRVKQTLDLLTEGVVLLDAKENIALTNTAFNRIFRTPGASLLGRKISDLDWHVPVTKSGKRRHSFQFPWVRALRVGEIQVGVSIYMDDERSGMRTFMCNSCPICDADYKIQGVLVTFDDVTELESMVAQLETSRDEIAEKNRQLERTNQVIEAKVTERTKALVEAKETAEAADHAKTVFLANISHELRTPMHAILSFSEFGVNKIERASRKKLLNYFELIKSSGSNLLSLVNDLLDLSKFQAGRMTCESTRNDLKAVAESVLKELSGMIQEKNLQVELQAGEFDTTGVFDTYRISQVVRNLVSNAIKFSSSEKSVTVQLKEGHLRSDDGQVPALVLSVSDEGPGIPEQELEKIFEPFFQSERTQSGAGGTGLGLAICKEIVEAHKGIIRADNRPECGSIFTLAIPVVLSDAKEPSESLERPESPEELDRTKELEAPEALKESGNFDQTKKNGRPEELDRTKKLEAPSGIDWLEDLESS